MSSEGALAGAGTGAAIGTGFAPGIGTVAGAIIGGLLGSFLGDDAEDAEKRQREREAFLDFQKEKHLAGARAQRLSLLGTGKRFDKETTSKSNSALSEVGAPSAAETGAPKAPSALSGTF